MDKEEYTRIVSKYYDDIKRVAFAGCKNIYDAEDIVQTTFIKLLQPQKASLPIDLTLLGMLTVVKLVQLMNDLLPIDVT